MWFLTTNISIRITKQYWYNSSLLINPFRLQTAYVCKGGSTLKVGWFGDHCDLENKIIRYKFLKNYDFFTLKKN